MASSTGNFRTLDANWALAPSPTQQQEKDKERDADQRAKDDVEKLKKMIKQRHFDAVEEMLYKCINCATIVVLRGCRGA